MFVAGPAGAQGRPYRRAMGHPKASAHVKRYKGKGVYAAGGGRLRGAKGGRRRGGNVRGGAVSLGAEPRIVGRPAARMAILRPGYGGHVQKVVPRAHTEIIGGRMGRGRGRGRGVGYP